MRKSIELVTVFTQIEASALATDQLAGQILLAARNTKAETVEQFNDMVYAAYDAKGWSHRQGRPMPGDVAAPNSVKVYLSNIRAAYANGVKVLDYDSIFELRKALAIAKGRMAASSPAIEVAPELKGLEVKGSGRLNGAPFHDIVELYRNLPEKLQLEILEKVTRMVTQYSRKAPPALRMVA